MNLDESFHYKNYPLDDNHCFLCGKLLIKDNSIEHIFPKWLLREFNLWNRKISLRNNSFIPYRRLTVPCCQECNNNRLSAVEQQIHEAFLVGYDAFKNLSETIIVQWISKIFYGLLFRETSLRIDQKQPEIGFLADHSDLDYLKLLRMFILSSFIKTRYHGGYPWSLFLTRIMDDKACERYTYRDNYDALSFALRMNDIGIIAVLDDNGLVKKELEETFSMLEGHQLHPIQFDEMYTKALYVRLLQKNIRGIDLFYDSEEEKVEVLNNRLVNYSSSEVANAWNNEHFAHYFYVFAQSYGFKFDEIYKPDKGLRSFTFTTSWEFISLEG